MKPSDCPKCRKLFAADEMAQIKMQAEAMRVVEEYGTTFVNRRYAEAHRDGLHESKLDAAPKPEIIRPGTNGGKKR